MHVVNNGAEAVFEIILENGELKEVRGRNSGKQPPLDTKDMAMAEMFVKRYYKNIVEKWVNFFVYKKRIRSTKITKRL